MDEMRSLSSTTPDYLVIGHVTRDLYDGGYKIGGTVTYSALTARNLGCTVGIVTAAAGDLDLSCLPDDIALVARASATSTTFENLYHDGQRRQFLWARARELALDDVPAEWRSSAIVHLGPVAQEVAQSAAFGFPGSLLGLTPQGWMRSWDEGGLVKPAAWKPPADLLSRADAVILSLEDVGGDLELVRSYAVQARLVVLTAGWKGATVYWQGEVRSFPAPQVRELDPTGAGDIFAAAFLVSLRQSGDPWLAARFANCVASRSVERSGVDSIPTRHEIAVCRAGLGLPEWKP